ncbi:hypothetical protein PV728_32000 [Streptomyces europaeiscabiei]|uniref:hypothetical protein n=1 Tax=Streptomyces europaeiscabiei TaxID=146819 RepID=UPI0029A0014E|nr:hypothetical protein [Streptomyces europaeiscabiei]MDX3634801.1 hypothetical protein [Streptomyces europaeiscabiei]MDX3652757.1 hypothetical protein [Streptomyces europaeiscabiei]
MITDRDVTEAEARVAEMRERGSRLKMAKRDEVSDAVRLEVGRLTELKDRKTAQDAALKARKAAERTHLPELKKMNAELSDSAESVDKAREAAAAALSKLIAAVRGHNDVLGAVHGRLTALGLPLGDEVVDTYESGHGSAGVLRVNGTVWSPVPPDTLTMYVVSQVVADAFGPKHPEARVRDVRIHSLLRASNGRLTAA